MQAQCSVLGYKIYLSFFDDKFAIEIYENGLSNGNINSELKKQESIEQKVGFEFIRIDPGKADFNIFKAFYEIYSHLRQWPNQLTKNYWLIKF